MVLAALLGLVLAFAGLAAVSRAVNSNGHTPAPASATSSASSSGASASPSPTVSGVVAPEDQADDVTIQSVSGAFVDAWLQRDRTRRKAQLAATATPDLAAGLIKTETQNIPRTAKDGDGTLESRAEGVAIVVQALTDGTVLRITLTQTSTGWLVSAVDLAEV